MTEASRDRRSLVAEIHQLERELSACKKDAEDAKRYRWLADRVLYCDYGDNDAGAGLVGYGIRHDLRDGEQFMFAASPGASIDAAIDSAMHKEKP